MLRGVARSVHRPESDVSQPKGVLIKESLSGEAVLPVRSAFSSTVNGCAGGRGQLAGAGVLIRVNVSFCERHDAHVMGLSQLLVHVNVTAGIRHHRFAFSLEPMR